MKILCFGKSVQGKDHEENEDNLLIDLELKLFAVADGVTIPKGGKKAAEKAIKYLKLLFEKDLKGLVEKVNEKILEEMDNDPVGYTTLAVAYIKNNILQTANIGDSSIFLIRDKISLLTASDRIFGTHALTQAIGQEYLKVDFREEKLKKGDYIILATDGITDVLSEEEIFSAVKNLKEPKKIVDFLIEKAKDRPKVYEDDKTLIVIHIGD
ncbi:MAG: serine/threonine-protein phosphatase [Candidatus Aenigmatarchaeota archaeon]